MLFLWPYWTTYRRRHAEIPISLKITGLWTWPFMALACDLLLLPPTRFPRFFRTSTARTSMKLGIRVPYGESFITFWFLIPFSKKNLAPPMNLAFFVVSPPKFFYLSLVSQWNLAYLLLIDMALWRFGFLPNFRKKKSRPSYGLSIFLWFPQRNSFIITGIPMKLGIPTHYWHGFMTFWFFTQFSKKKILPLLWT